MTAIGSSWRVTPTAVGCAIGSPGDGSPMVHGTDVPDSDRVTSRCSATVISGRCDVGSTGVILGVGSGLLVTCISGGVAKESGD